MKEQIIEIDFEKVMKRIENLSCFEDLSEDEIQEILDVVVESVRESNKEIPILYIHGKADSFSYQFSRKYEPISEKTLSVSDFMERNGIEDGCGVCKNSAYVEYEMISDTKMSAYCHNCGVKYTLEEIDE